MKLSATQRRVLQAMANGESLRYGFPDDAGPYRLRPSGKSVRRETLDALYDLFLIGNVVSITPAGRKTLEN